ncbi:hypothetical protein CRV24_003705 [Beauveria bassiana]|nr:hypothetical protein CRV24_003705 [Beauveria bassiana]
MAARNNLRLPLDMWYGPPRSISMPEKMKLVIEVGDRKTAVQCGRSRVADQMHDKLLMFLDKLHVITSRQSGKLSSFFVQRSIYLAYFGQDLSISCDAMQTAPEENSIHGISMRVKPAAGEAFAGFPGFHTQMEVDGRVEDEYRTILQNAQRETDR